jgi:hypothetical protein
MISNIKIFLLCPVPEDQKPINEYIALKENSFTSWITFSKKKYRKTFLSFLFFFLFLVSLFHFNNENEKELQVFPWLVINFLISLNTVFFFLLINFIRWKQIQIRFNNSRVFYEEASWYDGQIWEKPFSIIKNDRLLNTQKIIPILERISRTMFLVFCFNLFLISFLLFS